MPTQLSLYDTCSVYNEPVCCRGALTMFLNVNVLNAPVRVCVCLMCVCLYFIEPSRESCFSLDSFHNKKLFVILKLNAPQRNIFGQSFTLPLTTCSVKGFTRWQLNQFIYQCITSPTPHCHTKQQPDTILPLVFVFWAASRDCLIVWLYYLPFIENITLNNECLCL